MCLINKRNTDVYVFLFIALLMFFFDICDQLRLKHVFLFSKKNTYKINLIYQNIVILLHQDTIYIVLFN